MTVTVELVAMISGAVGIAVIIVVWITRAHGGLRKQITDHQLFAAEHYVTKEGLSKDMNQMRDSIDKLSDRIDRVLETKRARG